MKKKSVKKILLILMVMISMNLGIDVYEQVQGSNVSYAARKPQIKMSSVKKYGTVIKGNSILYKNPQLKKKWHEQKMA